MACFLQATHVQVESVSGDHVPQRGLITGAYAIWFKDERLYAGPDAPEKADIAELLDQEGYLYIGFNGGEALI